MIKQYQTIQTKKYIYFLDEQCHTFEKRNKIVMIQNMCSLSFSIPFHSGADVFIDTVH